MGVLGTPGFDGVKGAIGDRGFEGAPGRNGIPGAKGRAGDDGVNGGRGFKGARVSFITSFHMVILEETITCVVDLDNIIIP